jgi:hypothetical protein
MPQAYLIFPFSTRIRCGMWVLPNATHNSFLVGASGPDRPNDNLHPRERKMIIEKRRDICFKTINLLLMISARVDG